MSETIFEKVADQVKVAMRARDKERVAALRLMMAEFKRVEIDERIKLDDQRVLAILDKMTKQRNESKRQYSEAGRSDLEEKEAFELAVIADFMPQQLSEEDIANFVDEAIRKTGAKNMREMGDVMSILKIKAQGRADLGKISALVKAKLS